jgi:hypothetical protein
MTAGAIGIASGFVAPPRHGDETFEAGAETEKILLDAIAQCDRGQATQMSDLPPRRDRFAPPKSGGV